MCFVLGTARAACAARAASAAVALGLSLLGRLRRFAPFGLRLFRMVVFAAAGTSIATSCTGFAAIAVVFRRAAGIVLRICRATICFVLFGSLVLACQVGSIADSAQTNDQREHTKFQLVHVILLIVKLKLSHEAVYLGFA